MSLGQALRHLRKEQGLTLAELAKRTNSHVGNLSRIERDVARPSLDTLYLLAKALGFSLTDIFSVAENRLLDPDQVALNAIFISLLGDDKELLLDFARLLQERSGRGLDDVAVGSEPMPAEPGEPIRQDDEGT